MLTRINPLTGGTSFGGRTARNHRRLNDIFNKKIGDRLLGTKRISDAEREQAEKDARELFDVPNNVTEKHDSVEKLKKFGNQELSVRDEDYQGLFDKLAEKYGGAVAYYFTGALEHPNFLKESGFDSYANYLQDLIDSEKRIQAQSLYDKEVPARED